MTPPPDRPNPLSVRRAFVVQVHTDADIDARRVTGRIEHVASGKAAHFPSLEALLDFIAGTLREENQPP